jgi:pimeloyl-ACP methyl ester carboxylesterase
MAIRRLRYTAGAILTAAAVLLGSGCSSGGAGQESTRPPGGDAALLKPLPSTVPSDLQRYYDQKLSWHDCGVMGFQCGSLTVPLDYDHPSKDTDVKLAVARKKATGRKPIGSLMVNPGGPGGSAIDYLQNSAALAFPAPILKHYDMVGMDPRGVARSESVDCLTDKQMDSYTRADQTPDDKQEADKLVAAYRDFAESCAKKTGDLLGHVSTIEAARDMDVLRAALGDKKLYYYGASYGTYLGATYAGLFPQRTGRLVLDGAMDPSLSSEQINRQQAGGFQTAFTAFAKNCVKQSTCPLGHESAKDAGKELDAFFDELDAHPVKAGNGRTLTESLATTGVIQAMYLKQLWPRVRKAIREAEHGDGAGLLALSDAYYEREPDGSYGTIMFSNPAVNCLDLPPAFSGPDEVRGAVDSFEKASPVFGRGFAWAALNCAYWPEKATGEPHTVKAKGAAPILVVGTTRDPATPYRWAQGLAGQLSSGHLLTHEGDGHTAFLQGSACIDSAITAYLVKGTVPDDGTRCS